MIFLPIKVQELLFACQRVDFVITLLLSVVSLYFLLKKTPPNQAGVRPYLLFIQVLVMLSSVYLDVMLSPIPLFPAWAGYCVGLLCKAGVSPTSVLAVFVDILIFIGLAIFACTFYRHQTIIPPNSWLNFGKRFRISFQALMSAIIPIFPLPYIFYPFDKGEMVQLVKVSPLNIAWIIERAPCFMHKRDPIIVMCIYGVILTLITVTSVVLFLFWHMFYVLRTATNHSSVSNKRVKQSLIVLFLQIVVPLNFVVFPAIVLFTSLACECIPFEITLPAYCVLTLHPLMHNIALLTVTPTYRRFIISIFTNRFCFIGP